MEHLEHLDRLQTIEEKAKYMDVKFRLINGKINGENADQKTRNTYAIFYGAIIYGPRPLKMVRTKEDLKEFITLANDFLTIEKIFNLFINSNLWTNSNTSKKVVFLYRDLIRNCFYKHFSNEKKNPIYYFYLEYKKLTPSDKIKVIDIYDKFINKHNQAKSYGPGDPDNKYTHSRAEAKINTFLFNERIKLNKEGDQKRTLRGFLCGCGGAYQTPGNDRHFLTAKHLKFSKEQKIRDQKNKEEKEKEEKKLKDGYEKWKKEQVEGPEKIKRIRERPPSTPCGCGGTYTSDITRHLRTKRHRDFITQKQTL